MSDKLMCVSPSCRGRTFANPSSLKRHWNDVHVKNRKHRCAWCGLSFTSSARLTDHEKAHGEREHVCTCGRRFTRAVDLRRHEEKRFPNCKPSVMRPVRKDFQTVSDDFLDESDPGSVELVQLRPPHAGWSFSLPEWDLRSQSNLHTANEDASRLAVSAFGRLIKVCALGLKHLHGDIGNESFSTWLRHTELDLINNADAMLGYNGMADMAVACYSFVVETRHYARTAGVVERTSTAALTPGSLERLPSCYYEVLDWPIQKARASSDSHELVVSAQCRAPKIRRCIDSLVTAGEMKLRTHGPAPGRRLADAAGMFTEVYVYILAWFTLSRNTERFLHDGVWHERLWEITES